MTSIDSALRRYFSVLYLVIFGMILLFWPMVRIDGLSATLFALAATAGYALLYSLPCVLSVSLVRLLLRRQLPQRAWARRLLFGLAWLLGGLALLCIYADYRLYELYQFHFNSFVWNLLTTPGGIAALGATSATERTVAWQVGLCLLATAVLLWLCHRHAERGWTPSARSLRMVGALLLVLLAAEEMFYAYCAHTGKGEMLEASDAIPFHFHTRASNLFSALGIEHTALRELHLAGGKVDYPGQHLPAKPPQHLPNVIMLVGESLRWDLLTPEIMPNLWRFSQQAVRFENHYSGGNRTRIGLFSMFYGIYASYWYSFEQQRVAPALMNYLREHGYQFALHTSQSFNYPELRHTTFAGVPESAMQELYQGDAWRRDTQNITDLMGKLDRRDRGKPFYGFMFFESTHAPYSFPEATALRQDYLKEMDYIKLDLRDNIQGIHARYINAAHHIDQQVGRLLDYLQAHQMLNDTIVLFSGDHGEEFMEKGRWGHGTGNAFPEEQIRVPLVLWLPGHAPQVIRYRTSHLQISPTLLETLGVTAPAHDYCSAVSLFTPLTSGFVLGEFDHMGLIVDGKYKISFPYTGSSFFHYTVFDINDHLVSREENARVVAQAKPELDKLIAESRRFVR